jgi:hypothetical protein
MFQIDKKLEDENKIDNLKMRFTIIGEGDDDSPEVFEFVSS